MIRGQQSPRWAFMRVFEVPDREDPSRIYLRRLRIVQTPWFGVYLHRIYLPDSDRDPHDHPWLFASLILRGGYLEHVWDQRDDLSRHRSKISGRWSLHRMPTWQAHRIMAVKDRTVTLVLVGRRQRQWGFWTADGWVPWTAYTDVGLGPDPFGEPRRRSGTGDNRRWRWHLAGLVNRLPGMCWSSLAMWAMADDQRRLRDCHVDANCHGDMERLGGCYCGNLSGPLPERWRT